MAAGLEERPGAPILKFCFHSKYSFLLRLHVYLPWPELLEMGKVLKLPVISSER